MDTFRREQKKQCAGGWQSGTRTYGCPCCLPLGMNRFKKMSRKLAKRRLKMKDRQRFREAV